MFLLAVHVMIDMIRYDMIHSDASHQVHDSYVLYYSILSRGIPSWQTIHLVCLSWAAHRLLRVCTMLTCLQSCTILCRSIHSSFRFFKLLCFLFPRRSILPKTISSLVSIHPSPSIASGSLVRPSREKFLNAGRTYRQKHDNFSFLKTLFNQCSDDNPMKQFLLCNEFNLSETNC